MTEVQAASATSALPNYVREYETIYILKPEFEDPQVLEVIEKMRALVAREGGKTIRINNWGKKKLAYEVDANQKGIYVYHLYVGAPKVTAEFERNLRIMDPVILHMTVQVNAQVLADQRQVEPDVLVPPVKEARKERERSDDDDGPVFERPPRERDRDEDDDTGLDA